MDKKIDVFNKQGVALEVIGPRADEVIVVMRPLNRMTPNEALVHAAWLLVIAETLAAEQGGPSFADVLAAVENT